MAKQYNRVMLGRGGQFAEECFKGGFIGADFDIPEDLTAHLYDNWRDFNKRYIPVLMQNNPDKTKVAAGLGCGALWTICKGLQVGDIVLCPNGKGEYYVGEVAGAYHYVPGTNLPHRRPVKWRMEVIRRADMSDQLRHSSGSIGTCSDVTRYADEIENMLALATKAHAYFPIKPVVKSTPQKKYLERDLHPLFCSILHDKYDILSKTIYHEKSGASDKAQKWVHPDIIGVLLTHFQSDETKTLQKAIDAHKSVCLYSFEMKREINSDYDLKEYFFQTLSNSNWANKGYLVAYYINDELNEEMERLNAAFGIGIIRMQAHKEDTQILFEAREKEIDYATLDKLCKINPDVREFISKLNLLLNSPKSYVQGAQAGLESVCDKIFTTDTEIEQYCKEKNIPY